MGTIKKMDLESMCNVDTIVGPKKEIMEMILNNLYAMVDRHEFIEVPKYSGSNRISNRQWGDRDSGGYASWGEDDGIEPEMTYKLVSVKYKDIEKRLNAVDNIQTLRKYDEYKELNDFLREVYEHHEDEQVVMRAGEHLGYCKLRVLYHLVMR